jgi:hypothetical protein
MNRIKSVLLLCGILSLLASPSLRSQDSQNPDAPQHENRRGEAAPRPIFGKISSVNNGLLVLATPDGQTVTVKLTGETQFRKDRQPASAADFKVGDMVAVRGDVNSDHTVTASVVNARTGGPEGPGGGRGGTGGGAAMGTLGKDYVVGEVKSIEAPKLTILRPDNVSQTIELNENTSLRKGRESITMADIQVGDHIMARGAAQNDVFVPKGIMVMNPEQWKRMQEMRNANGGAAPPASSATPQSKPTEPPN